MLSREALGERYRLLGVGISELVDAKADSLDLADPKSLKRAKAERASDKARERFGADLEPPPRPRQAGSRKRQPAG